MASVHDRRSSANSEWSFFISTVNFAHCSDNNLYESLSLSSEFRAGIKDGMVESIQINSCKLQAELNLLGGQKIVQLTLFLMQLCTSWLQP